MNQSAERQNKEMLDFSFEFIDLDSAGLTDEQIQMIAGGQSITNTL